jgi:hypothetical protein
MMILHQVRHGRQDDHATNHVRCAETSRAKQSKRHIEATRPNIARPYTSQSYGSGTQRLPSKALKRHPADAYWGSINSRHGRKGTWMRTDKKGSGPASSQPLAGTGRLCRAKSCKADQKEVEAVEMACCTEDPCLGAGVSYPAPLPR